MSRLALGLAGLLAAAPAPAPAGDFSGNVVLVGWDRADDDAVRRLMAEGRMPRLKAMVETGGWAGLSVTEGPAGGKVGWSQVLTGYNSGMLGIKSRTHYRPIPAGLTVFERLKDGLGASRVQTALISGPEHVLSALGPHEICGNCPFWRPDLKRFVPYWDFRAAVAPPGEQKTPQKREGEPFFNAARAIDIHETGTGPNTLARSLAALERLRGGRFFAVFHFSEPSQQAFFHGPSSPDYAAAPAGLDGSLGEILDKLDALGLKATTAVLVTTDLGFEPEPAPGAEKQPAASKTGASRPSRPKKSKKGDAGENTQDAGPIALGRWSRHKKRGALFETFAASSLKGLSPSGDRRDLAPTVLSLFGLPPEGFKPPFMGRTLFKARAASARAPALPQVRIGFFLGGRTSLLYRALLSDAYRAEGIDVELLTKKLREDQYAPLERSFGKYGGFLGKATGTELVDGVVAGKFDGASVGEMSFIDAVRQGKPIVAVAELGHDTKEKPGHGILLRKGIKVSSPKDLKGLRLVARRSSGGDLVMLREFLVSKGLDPDKDVTILDNVYEDQLLEGITAGKIDGGYFHLGTLRRLVRRDLVYLYEPLDWVDPELSHALLVFSEEFLRAHPDRVEKVLEAYMKQIRHETSLSEEERRKIQTISLVMETDFNGLNFPQYYRVPLVRPRLIDRMQDLLIRHRAIPRKVEVDSHVDNRFVEKAARRLYPSP